MKILFSVYNISGYLLAELEELSKSAEIAVIETPCKAIPKGVMADKARWIDRSKIESLAELERSIGDFKPDIFLCGGWMDKLFVSYAKKAHKQGIKTVLLIDTPWQGKLKQYIHCLCSRFYLTTTFDYAWGAGEPQERYLRYLGFSLRRIRRGYYCADTKKFAPIGEKRLADCGDSWPHTFLYIGRYVPVKNMRRMERAFIKAVESMPESDWKLKCIGGGQLWDERTIHPRIEHLGYKSPAEIQDYVRDAGCFVLPSVYEPWGVVVHEAALMGLPMLCSNQIQAATAYLKDGENGYKFDPLNEDELAKTFLKLMRENNSRLAEMSKTSYRLGKAYRVADWAERLMEFVR